MQVLIIFSLLKARSELKNQTCIYIQYSNV